MLFRSAGLLVLATLRGDRGEAEEGEDVDLSHRPDWKTVAQLVAIFALNIALVDFLGWAITGALLFAGVARSCLTPDAQGWMQDWAAEFEPVFEGRDHIIYELHR